MTISALFAMLVLVLYLPSAYPPERFLQQLRVEHQDNVQFWGEAHAMRIMSRLLDLQASSRAVNPVPTMAAAPRRMDRAVGAEMEHVSRRFFDNPYFRAVDTLLVLAMYRVSTFIEGMPGLWPFVAALLIDGLIRRVVKSKEFLHHDPEMFAIHVCATILLLCLSVIGLVAPWTVHPILWALVPLAISVFVSRGIGHFHRRG